MNHALSLLLLTALVTGVARVYGSPPDPTDAGKERTDLQVFLSGSPDDMVAQPRGGALLLGGGGDVDEAFRWFLKQADGGDIVVLRASGSDGYNDYLFSELGVEVNSVRSLVFDGRAATIDPRLHEWIRGAEGIFFAGGDQSKYYRYFVGSPVKRLVQERIDAGAVVGGSSAGLAILGQAGYSALHDGDLTSEIAMSDPWHPWITIDPLLRVPSLSGWMTDTHFRERGRLGRLGVFLCRLNAGTIESEETEFSGTFTGLGVDEATAVVIEADGAASVISRDSGGAHIVVVEECNLPQRGDEGAFSARLYVVSLDASSSIDFSTRRVDNPSAVRTYAIAGGAIRVVTPEESGQNGSRN